MFSDLKFALRSLFKSPTFTAIASRVDPLVTLRAE